VLFVRHHGAGSYERFRSRLLRPAAAARKTVGFEFSLQALNPRGEVADRLSWRTPCGKPACFISEKKRHADSLARFIYVRAPAPVGRRPAHPPRGQADARGGADMVAGAGCETRSALGMVGGVRLRPRVPDFEDLVAETGWARGGRTKGVDIVIYVAGSCLWAYGTAPPGARRGLELPKLLDWKGARSQLRDGRANTPESGLCQNHTRAGISDHGARRIPGEPSRRTGAAALPRAANLVRAVPGPMFDEPCERSPGKFPAAVAAQPVALRAALMNLGWIRGEFLVFRRSPEMSCAPTGRRSEDLVPDFRGNHRRVGVDAIRRLRADPASVEFPRNRTKFGTQHVQKPTSTATTSAGLRARNDQRCGGRSSRHTRKLFNTVDSCRRHAAPGFDWLDGLSLTPAAVTGERAQLENCGRCSSSETNERSSRRWYCRRRSLSVNFDGSIKLGLRSATIRMKGTGLAERVRGRAPPAVRLESRRRGTGECKVKAAGAVPGAARAIRHKNRF